MLLAEALIERAALQRKISDLQGRAEACAVYAEGEQPTEDVNALLTEAVAAGDALVTLIYRINVTNTTTTLPGGLTLTMALARRDALDLVMKVIRGVTDTAAGTGRRNYGYGRRTSHSELIDKTDLNVPARRAETDALAQTRRELDMAIQAANFSTELIGDDPAPDAPQE